MTNHEGFKKSNREDHFKGYFFTFIQVLEQACCLIVEGGGGGELGALYLLIAG